VKGLLPAILVAALLAWTAAPASGAATRAEYAAAVNPICAGLEAEAEQALKKIGRKPGAIAKLFKKLDRISDRGIDQIASVPPPPGDEALVAGWVEALRDLNAIGNRIGKISVAVFREIARPEPRLGKLKKLTRAANREAKKSARKNETATAAATQLGATSCGGEHVPAVQG
jgi:hypothetical protein